MSTSTNDSFWTPTKDVFGRYEHEGYIWDENKKMLVPPTGGGAWHGVRTKYHAQELVEKSIAEREADPLATQPVVPPLTGDYVDIVFDGPPGAVSGQFVETENALGAGINFGEWVDREDGLCALRIRMSDVLEHLTQ